MHWRRVEVAEMARRIGILAVVLLSAAVAVGAAVLEEREGDLEGTALLVVDIQAFYFADGMVPLVGPDEASLKARELVQLFRRTGRPVVHVQHLPKGVDVPDPTGIDPQYRIHPNVLPEEGEKVVGKHHANAFRDTELLAMLRGLDVRRLVICGMQTHMCVEAAVRAAADLGFEVAVAHDACATRDLEFGGVRVAAAQVHAAALAAMSGSYARVVSVGDLVEELE